MSDYTELVEALQWCAKPIPCSKTECPRKNTDEDCACHILQDAAAAIEDLQAQLPKRGEWVKNEERYGWHCSCCKVDNRYAYSWNSETMKNEIQDNYCPNCGAKMEVQE